MTNIENNSEKDFVFWDSKGNIDISRLFTFLESKGIGLYYPDHSKMKNSTPLLIQVKNNIVTEVTVSYLRKICFTHILKTNMSNNMKSSLRNSLYSKNHLINENNLMSLPVHNLNFLDDSEDKSFLFFQNGIVVVTANGIQLKPYKEIDRAIWANEILPYKFIPTDTSKMLKSDFSIFLEDITQIDGKGSKKRTKALASVLGYLCHRHKDKVKCPAVVLMDADPGESAKGRTGKTLISEAVGKVRRLYTIDGKSYDNRKSFRFSGMDLDTAVMLFDDVKRKFDFEALYSIITTGITIEKKYKNAIHLPFDKTPKVIITTNYALIGEGSSFNARVHEFEIFNTFNDTYTPIDKFGKRFFDDWNEEEWNIFFNLITKCIQVYLKYGLITVNSINLKLKKLLSSTNEDFVDFCEDNIEINKKLDKNSLHTKFLINYHSFKDMSKRTFTEWLRCYGNYIEAKVTETHSDNNRYIEFTKIDTS